MKYLALILTLLVSKSLSTADKMIEMLNKDAYNISMVYSEKIARTNVSDSISYILISKNQNAEFPAFSNKMKFKSKNDKKTDVAFEESGIY